MNNILKVYRIIAEDIEADEEVQEEREAKGKLECQQTFALFGKIAAIEAVAFSGSQRDSVLICLPEGKLSVVEYDPTTHDLKTLSLHYFEDEEMREGFTQSVIPPIIKVDPDGRCAAFLVYGRNIVILPFRKEALLSDDQHQQIGVSTITAPSSSVKTPVLSSYKLNLSDELYAGEKIQNMIDIAFLEGYNEPTLCILHEPIKTWSGRLAVRMDSCAMVALSLNIHQRVHPIIWSVNSLPYDCFRVMPVPKPVGGILMFTVNALIYLNQSVPPFGVSLNGFAGSSTAFPLSPQKGIKISLDACRSCFISNDKLLVSLKGGDLYVLTLFNDGMRSIRKFHFQKAASSVLTTCVTKCDGPYVFLGSRVGNSLLLKYNEKPYEAQAATDSIEDEVMADDEVEKETEKDAETDEVPKENGIETEVVANENGLKRDHSPSEDDEPLAKQIKTEPEDKAAEDDNIGDWMAKDIRLISADDFEVYGEAHDEVEKLPTSFSFEVCDSISNIAPCSKICMGEPAFLAEEFSDTPVPQVELVASSGFRKNGALSLLQRTIRPQIVTTLQLTNSIDIWTVFSPSHSAEYHSFIVISKRDSTIIFQAGAEINELDQSGFSTQTRTILAANIGQNKYVVQVSPSGARLLEGSKQIQYLPIDIFGSPVAFATASDPYVLLLTENGVAAQLLFNSETQRLMASKPKLSQSKSKILTCCIYKDVSGLFTTESPHDQVIGGERVQVKTESDNAMTIAAATTIDDEDELLYGDASVEDIAKLGTTAAAGEGEATETSFKAKVIRKTPATFWFVVARENGVLEIYSMPDYSLSYYIKNFPMTPKVLVDSGQGTDSQAQDMPVVKEIVMTGLGMKESRPHLFARLEDQVFVYEAFPFHESQITKHVKIRFRRLHEVVVLRQPRIESDDRTGPKSNISSHPNRCWLRPFENVSGYAGVFLCGSTPTWFMMTSRGELRKHSMTIDGAITSFSSFHNVNCSKGFLYFNQMNDLRIAQLPTQVTYDAVWPQRKIPFKSTVHSISYHVQSKCYIAVTSKEETFDKLVRVAGDEKDYEVLERDEGYIWPTYDKFSMELFSPVSWEAIAGTQMEFEEWEHVTVLKNVSLASEETESGLKGYIAVGTNYCYGEDVTNRGRIWILDIIDVVPEPGMPLTRNKIKMIYCKEQKGPVTALTQVKGFLLSAIGQKIYIWQLKESQLVGVAFIDTQIFINSAVCIKNLILVSDVYKSISLLRYQEQTRTLALVSRDTRSSEVFGSQFVVDQNQLCFVVSDSDGNLVVHSYNPEMRESFGGTRLIRRADFHLGSRTVSFFRIRCLCLADARRQELKQMTVYATLDGSMGYVLPVSEKVYRRLLMLQNVLNSHIQHLAGLNPKAYRMCKLSRKTLQPTTSKAMLDGDLLTKFNNLSFSEKNEVAKKIGSTATQVSLSLLVLDVIADFFFLFHPLTPYCRSPDG